MNRFWNADCPSGLLVSNNLGAVVHTTPDDKTLKDPQAKITYFPWQDKDLDALASFCHTTCKNQRMCNSQVRTHIYSVFTAENSAKK